MHSFPYAAPEILEDFFIAGVEEWRHKSNADGDSYFYSDGEGRIMFTLVQAGKDRLITVHIDGVKVMHGFARKLENANWPIGWSQKLSDAIYSAAEEALADYHATVESIATEFDLED